MPLLVSRHVVSMGVWIQCYKEGGREEAEKKE
jgi:hypothetical protein